MVPGMDDKYGAKRDDVILLNESLNKYKVIFKNSVPFEVNEKYVKSKLKIIS